MDTIHDELVREALDAQSDAGLKAAARRASIIGRKVVDHTPIYAMAGVEYGRNVNHNAALIRLRAFAEGKTHGLYGHSDVGYLTREVVLSDLAAVGIGMDIARDG